MFIYGPFMVQGMVYMLTSVLLAFGVFLLIKFFGRLDAIPLMFQDVFLTFE